VGTRTPTFLQFGQITRYCGGILPSKVETMKRSKRNLTTKSILYLYSVARQKFRADRPTGWVQESPKFKISSKSRFSAVFRPTRRTLSSPLLPSHHLPSHLSLFLSSLPTLSFPPLSISLLPLPVPLSFRSRSCKAVTGLATFSARIVIYLMLIRRAGT